MLEYPEQTAEREEMDDPKQPRGASWAINGGNCREREESQKSSDCVVRAKPKQTLFCSCYCDPFWLKTSLRRLGNEWYLEIWNHSPIAKLIEKNEKSSSAESIQLYYLHITLICKESCFLLCLTWSFSWAPALHSSRHNLHLINHVSFSSSLNIILSLKTF